MKLRGAGEERLLAHLSMVYSKALVLLRRPAAFGALLREYQSSGLVEDIGVGPLHQDEELRAKANKEDDVNHEPGNPCEKSLHANVLGLHDGVVFADDGHVAFVPISELGAEGDFALGMVGGFQAGFFLENFGDMFTGLSGSG